MENCVFGERTVLGLGFFAFSPTGFDYRVDGVAMNHTTDYGHCIGALYLGLGRDRTTGHREGMDIGVKGRQDG